MKTFTRKSDVKIELAKCISAYDESGMVACSEVLKQTLLSHKVKFPLLEYCATKFNEYLTEKEQFELCDLIQSMKTEGGNVILGILLQKQLSTNFGSAIQKTIDYVSEADIWYVCDIIGERVFGVALLTKPEQAIPVIKKLFQHPSIWVVRSLGAGIHYAIKKGLDEKFARQLFQLLLTQATNKNKEIRQGVGWAAKTTAKFHPQIIIDFNSEIYDDLKTANWFRTKIQIGLNRHHYAKGN